MGKHAFSLKTIYLAALTVVFAVSFFAFAVFDFYSQQNQTEAAMLEEARTFAREMDAVWQFMDNSQSVINNTSDGTFEFKGLHCSIVGKSVGAIFSARSDYAIRYTNFNPRSIQDNPDEFESASLEQFNTDRSVTEHYGVADFEGNERFRYVRALKVDESCLECHGEPVGEIDITGHKKEGWSLDSVGGAISVVIPLDQQSQARQDNIVRNMVFFLLLTVFIGGTIYLVTTLFVFRPVGRMKAAFVDIGEKQLGVSLDEGRTAKEIANLIVGFNEMSSELRAMYENLEGQVADRTLDLKKANEELEQQRDNLERLSAKLSQEAQFKSDLLSMVNHELRTPLTSIITLAQISREAGKLGEEADRCSWEDVEKNSSILLEMINNMLDIARSEAGIMSAMYEPMDLGDVTTAMRGTMMPLAQKYQVELTTHVSSEVPLVNGDFEKTQRILENLVSNAIKFTPDGGHVDVYIERESVSDDVIVRVSDNGIGIAEEDMDRIFDRFTQVDSTSTRKYNGSGLGLAIVKQYAELQSFSVSVESSLGEGSTFAVRIPAAETLV